jgi:hypothetical protein
MMKKFTHSKFNQIISILVFTLVVFSGSVFAQGWSIYDGSAVPNSSVPTFVTASGTYVPSENQVIVDPLNVDNYLLRMDIPGLGGTTPIPGQTAFLWRYNLPTGIQEITIVMRIKGNAERDMALDLDMEFNSKRTRISFYSADNKSARRTGASGADVILPVNVTEWNIYRFTMTATETKLYVNEGATVVQTIVPNTGSANYFRIGDGDNGRTFGADIDWIIWDVTGAYPPGSGTPIPNPVVTPSWNANLEELNVDGSLIEGFSASTLNYEVVLPKGTIIVPTVTAVADDTEATVDITPAAAIPGSTSILVTAENGITKKTYNVAFRIVSEVASLSSISVNSVAIAGFNPEVLEYTVNLPLETTVDIPVVTAVATDANADIVITQATEVDGEATIVVTAEDGITELTYIVDFVLVSTDATLKDLLIDGVTITGFDPEVIEYSLAFAEGTTDIPVVTALSNNDNAEINITQATAIPGSATVVVTAENGVNQKTYTINLLIGSSDATLSDLLVDGATIEGFDPEVTDYYLILPISVTDIPVVTATATEANATVDITAATEVPGTTTVKVTAEDNFTELLYKVHFRSISNDATLSDLLINGSTIVGFDPEVVIYNITMPKGSNMVPSVTAEANNENAGYVITPAEQIPGSTQILVTAEDNGTTKLYTINFSVSNYNWRYYDASVLPDVHVPIFASSNVGGAGGTNVIVPDPEDATNGFLQIITAVNADNYMWSTPLQTQTPGVTLVFKVKAANDVARRVLELDLHHNGIRERLYINRQDNKVRLHEGIGSTEVSVPEGTSVSEWNIYRLTKVNGVTKLYLNENPVPIAVGSTTTSTTSQYFRFGDGNGSHNIAGLLDWIVWDETGAYAPGEGLFIPDQVVTPNWDASLSKLLVDGTQIEGFDSDKLDYEVVFNEAPTQLPVISATINYEGATLVITQIDEFPGTAKAEVTAENGFTVNNYNVLFRLISSDASLANLLVDEVQVEGFVPEVFDYDILLPLGTTVVPTVTAIANSTNAEVDITQAPALPGQAKISVTAEDGTEKDYLINFTVATSTGITKKAEMKLFPNPATNNITVEWAEAAKGAELRIICASGRVVLSKKVENSSEEINISNLMPGVYIIHVVSNHIQVRSRFIKQ